MNMQEVTTMIAKSIAEAYAVSLMELENRLDNPNIEKPNEEVIRRMRWDLENHYFEIVTKFRGKMSEASYLSLCTKIDIAVGHRFTYRP